MSQAGSLSSMAPDPPSGWHSIRPWNAQLSLYVREITSVSATFILATDPSREAGCSLVDPSLAALGLNAAAESEHDGEQESPSSSSSSSGSSAADESSSSSSNNGGTRKKPQSLITETLSKGLRVNVNSVNWQRVLIRVDEKADEAVIIIYGLMPGRQYDIDLALVQPGQTRQVNTVRRQVLTFEEEADSNSEMSTDPDSPDPSNSSSDAHHTVSTPSTSPCRTIPSTPPPTSNQITTSTSTSSSSSSSSSSSVDSTSSSPPQISLEERLNQLHHSLSLINAERETLLASLKSARKDSQKADAAVRSEMEALKRASEKHSAGEIRARQKMLALQESVKRAQAATKETEESVEAVESEVPELLKQKEAKEKEHRKVKEEADRAKKMKETEVQKEKKRQESMRAELQSLTNKFEKLTAKVEKHETTIPDLEEQLSAVEKDIEEQERLLMQLEMNREFEDVNRLVLSSVGQQQSGVPAVSLSPTTASPLSTTSYHHSTLSSQQYFANFGGEHPHQTGYVPVQLAMGRRQSLGAPSSQPQPSSSTVVGSNSATTPGPGPIGSRPNPPAPIQRPNFSSSTTSSVSPTPVSHHSLDYLHLHASAPSFVSPFQQSLTTSASTPSSSSSSTTTTVAAGAAGSTNIWTPPAPSMVRRSPTASTTATAIGHGGPGRSSSLPYQHPAVFSRDSALYYTRDPSTSAQQSTTGATAGGLSAQRRGSLKSTTSTSSSSSSSGAPGAQQQAPPQPSSNSSHTPSASAPSLGVLLTGPTATNPSAASITASTSTLSSRAPAFEPGKRTAAGGLHGLRILTSSAPTKNTANVTAGSGDGAGAVTGGNTAVADGPGPRAFGSGRR